ncbi:peptide-methionine (S)-S-oxide reductase MsrA [Alkalicoccus daliensis]|uniref:Peptide methionine sulfoxide reductase MsrA n=1 Tax=Alkalicoccus daliensis TaxID=745820 RepID=A0A1H0AL31_9BACI|nr:peptide-methionine (S)-S-oxide reductase MsrA [Alkalicoccus daliensis]SDN34061.1 peptide-methionine (S)-S-oxide reductase [Alkalicoccus daliensis]
MKNNYKVATFAGGCFWCMVKPFDEQPGIINVTSGYTGGDIKNPTYEEVKSGKSGHYEAVQIKYNPDVFTYASLLHLFWQQVDPTDDGGQFFDRGSQYRTAIFYHSSAQYELAAASKRDMEENGPFRDPIVTEILPAAVFYEAEEEHQKFYKKNPEKYRAERVESGREGFINSHWD